MDFYVYILFSFKKKGFYIGQTNNLIERVARHNSGSEIYTSKFSPWVLVWSTKKSSRSDAMALEKKLKNLTKKRILLFCKKYPDGLSGSDEFCSIEQKLSE